MSFAANDLAGVEKESQQIWKSVNEQKDVLPKKVEDASIEDIADEVIDAGKDLFMFHFGGHADETGIVLDGFKDLDKIRLSRLLLPKNHHIQIVFLNGCLSYGLVDIFTAKGVKAVIATNANVDDSEAVRMSKYFYKLFFEKEYSIKEAFETAEATVSGHHSFVTIVNPGETAQLNPSWTLFIHAHHQEVMNWTLKDFLNGGEKKPTETGDKVSGDKIERQINMGEHSTYIENQHNPYKNQDNPYKSTVHDLVANGKLEEALSTLGKHLPDAAKEITLIRARLSRLNTDTITGVLSSSEKNLERNKITSAILSLGDGY
jgi:hypothetical protein